MRSGPAAVAGAGGRAEQAYVEKARIAAANAVNTLHWRYYSNLAGRLHYVDAKIDPPSARIYCNVPPEIHASVTEAERQQLKSLALTEDAGFRDAMTLFCQVLKKEDYSGLTANQVIIRKEIRRRVQARRRCPVLGKDEQFTRRIPPGNRLIRKIRAGRPLIRRQQGMDCLARKIRAHYHCTLAISNPLPGGPALLFRLLLRLVRNGKACARSLAIGIGDEGARVKRAAGRKKPNKQALNKCDAIIGEDFGCRNTMAIANVIRGRTIKPAEVERIQGLDKQGAKD